MRDRYYDHKKKSSSCLSGRCVVIITTEKKKIQSSVWRVRDRYYDRKKKVLVVCLAGAQSLLRPEKKVPVYFLVLRTYLVYNVQLCYCVSILVVAGNSSY